MVALFTFIILFPNYFRFFSNIKLIYFYEFTKSYDLWSVRSAENPHTHTHRGLVVFCFYCFSILEHCCLQNKNWKKDPIDFVLLSVYQFSLDIFNIFNWNDIIPGLSIQNFKTFFIYQTNHTTKFFWPCASTGWEVPFTFGLQLVLSKKQTKNF